MSSTNEIGGKNLLAYQEIGQEELLDFAEGIDNSEKRRRVSGFLREGGIDGQTFVMQEGSKQIKAELSSNWCVDHDLTVEGGDQRAQKCERDTSCWTRWGTIRWTPVVKLSSVL